MTDLASAIKSALQGFTDTELREEANRRGYEMHHKGFSVSMQNEIRACVKLQQDAKALEERITHTLARVAKEPK